MLTKSIIAAGALLSMAVAVPVQRENKRDIVWETKIEEAIVTVDVTTTIWLNPGETPPVAPAGGPGGPGGYGSPGNYGHGAPGHFGHGHHGHPGNHGKPTNAAPPAEPTTAVPVPSEQPSAVAPASETPPPPVVAPTPTTTDVAPAPTTTWAAPPATTPAPVETTTAAPVETTTAAPVQSPPPSSGGGSAPSGETYTGDITYYTPGLGSCGIVSDDSEAVVALPHAMMAAVSPPNPNDNPYCGKTITISYGGKTASATVVDTCPGCEGGSIDLSSTLFSDFAALSVGRVSGVKWWFD